MPIIMKRMGTADEITSHLYSSEYVASNINTSKEIFRTDLNFTGDSPTTTFGKSSIREAESRF